MATVATFGDFPGLGRSGRVADTRELVIERYPLLIPNRVKYGEVQVLRVFYNRRKPPTVWQRSLQSTNISSPFKYAPSGKANATG
jgi:plasmid stabilization system protein ParE